MNTGVLFRLHNLPGLVQRLVAFSILAALIVLAIAVLILLYSFMSAKADGITSMRHNGGNLIAIARMGDRLGQVDDTNEVTQALESTLLPGETAALARANLQARFNAIAQSKGVSIASVGNAPDRVRNGIEQIGLSVSVLGEMIAVHNTLFELESARPILFIDDLVVRLTSNRQPSDKTVISAQFQIYGFFPQQLSASRGAE